MESNLSMAFWSITQQLNHVPDMASHKIMTRTVLRKLISRKSNDKVSWKCKKAHMWCVLQFGTISPIIKQKKRPVEVQGGLQNSSPIVCIRVSTLPPPPTPQKVLFSLTLLSTTFEYLQTCKKKKEKQSSLQTFCCSINTVMWLDKRTCCDKIWIKNTWKISSFHFLFYSMLFSVSL